MNSRLHDLAVLIGAAMAATGLWMIHPPTCLIVIGGGIAVCGALLGRPRR